MGSFTVSAERDVKRTRDAEGKLTKKALLPTSAWKVIKRVVEKVRSGKRLAGRFEDADHPGIFPGPFGQALKLLQCFPWFTHFEPQLGALDAEGVTQGQPILACLLRHKGTYHQFLPFAWGFHLCRTGVPDVQGVSRKDMHFVRKSSCASARLRHYYFRA